MAGYKRLGSLLLAEQLTEDPFGALHRGILTAEGRFQRHILVRTFSPAVLRPELWESFGEHTEILFPTKSSIYFGHGHGLEGETRSAAYQDYIPGQSLAAVLDRIRSRRLPLPLNVALTLLQGLSTALLQLHGSGRPYGILNPHAVWISYEGTVSLLDAHQAPALQEILDQDSSLQAFFKPYRPRNPKSPYTPDLFGMGILLLEMLLLDPPKEDFNLLSTIQESSLEAAQLDSPIPDDIQMLLLGLLLPEHDFQTAEDLKKALDLALHYGEHEPTTFEVAFFMHDTFREEREAEALAIHEEELDNYLFMQPEALAQAPEGIDHIPPSPPLALNRERLLMMSLGLLAALGMAGWVIHRSNRLIREKERQIQQTQDLLRLLGEQIDAIQKERSLKATEAKELRTSLKKGDRQSEERLKGLDQEQAELERREAQIRHRIDAISQMPTASVPLPDATLQPIRPAPTTSPQGPKPEPAPIKAHSLPPTTSQPDRPPQLLKKVPGRLPPFAARNPAFKGQTRTVRLKVFIDVTGRATLSQILQGVEGPHGFNESATEAALASTYQPALRSGQPRAEWLEVEYTFHIPK